MTNPCTHPVLIVGGGPSGLAAALTLSQNGIPVRIVEKLNKFHTASRGSGLHPKTLEVFRFLGVRDDVLRLGGPLVPMRSYKLPGGTEVTKTWDLLEKYAPTPDRPEDTIALSQYLTEEPASIEQDAEGVSVTLKKVGGDGAEQLEVMRASFVIGADGARGFTRKAIGAIFEGQTKDDDGQTWADAEIEGISSEYWNIWSEPGKVTISARPKNTTGGFHVGISGQGFDPVDLVDEQQFINFFREQTGRKDAVFKKLTSLTYWKPKMRMANKFSEGRVFIVGDAAHIHSPTGGQGLNTSVQDSFNLAWKMSLVYKGLASSNLLTTYQSERLPVVAHMLAATSNLYTHIVPKNAEEAKNDTAFLKWRNQSLRMLEINYRWSPIILDVRGTNGLDEDDMEARAYIGYPEEPVHAGDRAPNAPALVDVAGKETALFDMFKPRYHTVLIFSPDGEEEKFKVQSVVERAKLYPEGTVQTLILNRHDMSTDVEGATILFDKEGHAYRGYHVSGKELAVFVVRPDGYIGAFVRDEEALQKYFLKIFLNIH